MKKITCLHGIIVIAGLGLIAGCSTGPIGTGPMVAYALPVSSKGKEGTCPGSYVAYATYSVPATWGWVPSTNTTIHTASNGGGFSNICIEYIGEFGDTGCAATNVTLSPSPLSPAYCFTVFFHTSAPTTNYPIILTGFDSANN